MPTIATALWHCRASLAEDRRSIPPTGRNIHVRDTTLTGAGLPLPALYVASLTPSATTGAPTPVGDAINHIPSHDGAPADFAALLQSLRDYRGIENGSTRTVPDHDPIRRDSVAEAPEGKRANSRNSLNHGIRYAPTRELLQELSRVLNEIRSV